MKKLMILCLLMVASLGGYAQVTTYSTACEANYASLCAAEKNLLEEVKRLECRLDDIRKEKQKALVCVANEKNKQDLQAIEAQLLLLLRTVKEQSNKPQIVPIPCTTGNCN
jgi:hypothetical protein